jgi:hypothetical protein
LFYVILVNFYNLFNINSELLSKIDINGHTFSKINVN